MNRSTVGSRWNQDLLEEYHRRWSDDPGSVDATWRAFFEGYDLGRSDGPDRPAPGDGDGGAKQSWVTQLTDAYREMGHYLADLDPLGLASRDDFAEDLRPAAFGLDEADLDRTFHTPLFPSTRATLRELIAALQETYCRKIAVEFMHIRDATIRSWLIGRMESCRNHPTPDAGQKRRILQGLSNAELFETFLHGHFLGAKRFSLEGGESLIPLLDAAIDRAARLGVDQIVLGMPHRGRLNVLANTLGKPYRMIFGEFEDSMPGSFAGDGDVKYHLGFSADRTTPDGKSVHLSLTANPSHLEAVNPVVEGRVRAKQRQAGDLDRKLGLPILIHGDAAFAGQGLVAETLNLSQLRGYRTGGTLHVVVNNQVGFTTSPGDGRSTRYCTDVAKMIEVPIFHVNGDDPEAVAYVAELAIEFRQRFGRDVVIDLVCYRKHGHNETDEPAYTQPLMYAAIRARESTPVRYKQALIDAGDLPADEAARNAEQFEANLTAIYNEVHAGAGQLAGPPGFGGSWAGYTPNYSFAPVETGVEAGTLARVAREVVAVPDGSRPNPKVLGQLQGRLKAIEAGGGLDWATGEMLAFGTLLAEGTPIRLSGQDCGRGTFSHRHAVLVDSATGERRIPLNALAAGGAEMCAYDSLLSEAAVLGFDYGYSLDAPNMLILWEAQFGDFANGAQVIIDQFIASSESKWGRASGLVLLLPHGYEGQGPEHSSARLERFLALCAEDNIQVVNPTTPAQYFHLLRRQVRRDFRKPLVVMSPKSLLRSKAAVSSVEELTKGHFRDVIDDPAAAESAERVVFCSGKVYYDLLAHREKVGKQRQVAVVRIEQLYPWPEAELAKVLARYRSAKSWVWCQEESQNMGGWTFVAPLLTALIGDPARKPLLYAGRDASASPATGSKRVHDREQHDVVEEAIGAPLPHPITAKPARPVAAFSSKD